MLAQCSTRCTSRCHCFVGTAARFDSRSICRIVLPTFRGGSLRGRKEACSKKRATGCGRQKNEKTIATFLCRSHRGKSSRSRSRSRSKSRSTSTSTHYAHVVCGSSVSYRRSEQSTRYEYKRSHARQTTGLKDDA